MLFPVELSCWISCNSHQKDAQLHFLTFLHEKNVFYPVLLNQLTIVGEKVEEKQQLVSDLQKKSQVTSTLTTSVILSLTFHPLYDIIWLFMVFAIYIINSSFYLFA